ncbi:hypothetical protein BC830DRAFT_1191747, partial [Chytriomyces sp. MP71]
MTRQYCKPARYACQILSDPYINTLYSTQHHFDTNGSFWAVQSEEFQIRLHITQQFSRNLHQDVYIVDRVEYLCGTDSTAEETFSTPLPGPVSRICTRGACGDAGARCSMQLLPGLDPVPNVQAQEVWYLGTRGLGGLCFGEDGACPCGVGVGAAINGSVDAPDCRMPCEMDGSCLESVGTTGTTVVGYDTVTQTLAPESVSSCQAVPVTTTTTCSGAAATLPDSVTTIGSTRAYMLATMTPPTFGTLPAYSISNVAPAATNLYASSATK